MGKTRIIWRDAAYSTHPDGRRTGTFRSHTFLAQGPCLWLEDLTIENQSGAPQKAGQAVVAALYSRWVLARRVEFSSFQDTLFCGPLPPKERLPDGFLGPMQNQPREQSFQLYQDCRIAGEVDFIFGGAQAVFQNCQLHLRDAGRIGYLAAPSGFSHQLGMVFWYCTITADPTACFYLARPWRSEGAARFWRCSFPSQMEPEGFSRWQETGAKYRFSIGPNLPQSVRWATRMTSQQARQLAGQITCQQDNLLQQLDTTFPLENNQLQIEYIQEDDTMDIRYSCNQKDFKRYTTQETREEFLIQNLYQADQVVAVYSHVDRMVTLGCMPVERSVNLEQGMDIWHNFGTQYLLQRREMGLFNLGGQGRVTVDGTVYPMGYKDCLYIAMGAKEVVFDSEDATNPAKFFMVSAPAHCSYETRLIRLEDAAKKPLGSNETANKRVINQFIHPSVLKTCQLSMGMTCLESGSVWNTMPAHTHERRMEIYTYFEVPQDQVVFHMMGEGNETRHIVMQNEEAVISPSWSIHSGVGTSNYSFIWAMGGENQEFDDMDVISTTQLR